MTSPYLSWPIPAEVLDSDAVLNRNAFARHFETAPLDEVLEVYTKLDLGRAQLGRMAQAMEAHEAAHPVDVGLLRPYAVVKIADLAAQLIQQTGRGRICRHGEDIA